MRNRLFRFGPILAAVLALAPATASAGPIVKVKVATPTVVVAPPAVVVAPAPRVVVRPPCPGPNHVWVEGHWRADAYGRRVWVAGHWAHRPPVVVRPAPRVVVHHHHH